MAEVIELNNHRLLNGDATNQDDVKQLIGDNKVNLLLTDPPYGINIVQTVKIGERERANGRVGLPRRGRAKRIQTNNK